MNVYKIPESLYAKYHGTGYGLIATLNGEVVDLKYFEDVADEFYIEPDNEVDADRINEIVSDSRIGVTVRYFQSLGNIHVGIFSAYEFCEL